MNERTYKKHTGITHFMKAAGYSKQGLIAAIKHESAFRLELIIAIIMVPLAFYFAKNKIELILLIIPIILLLIIELINSAIEAVVDRIGLEHHELSGRAKDLGSASIFITSLLTIFIWIVILFT